MSSCVVGVGLIQDVGANQWMDLISKQYARAGGKVLDDKVVIGAVAGADFVALASFLR